MSVPARKAPVREFVSHLRRKSRALSRGGVDGDNHLQVGLLPRGGSLRRNYHFVRSVLLPQLFLPRSGSSLRPDLAPPEGPEWKVTWIGHASFLVQSDGLSILIDPVWARWLSIVKRVREPGIALDDLPPIHLVLITHAHFDHLHLGSLARVACGQPVIAPRGVGPLLRNRGFGEVVEVDPWEKVIFGPLEITFTPSKHWGARMVHDVHRGFGGYLIRNSYGRTVYHCGDSAYFEGFAGIGRHLPIDLAMMPIGAYRAMSGREVHMNPEEALRAFRDLNAGRMVPMHYGTFPLGGEPMDEPLVRLYDASHGIGVEKEVDVLDEGRPKIY